MWYLYCLILFIFKIFSRSMWCCMWCVMYVSIYILTDTWSSKQHTWCKSSWKNIEFCMYEKMYTLSHCHKINMYFYTQVFLIKKMWSYSLNMCKNARGEIHCVFNMSHIAIFNWFNNYIINFRNGMIRYKTIKSRSIYLSQKLI